MSTSTLQNLAKALGAIGAFKENKITGRELYIIENMNDVCVSHVDMKNIISSEWSCAALMMKEVQEYVAAPPGWAGTTAE